MYLQVLINARQSFPFIITLAFVLCCSDDLRGFINKEGLAFQGTNHDAVDGILSVFGYVSTHHESKPGNQHCGYARIWTNSYRLVPLNCFYSPRDESYHKYLVAPKYVCLYPSHLAKGKAGSTSSLKTDLKWFHPARPSSCHTRAVQLLLLPSLPSRQPESTTTSPSYTLCQALHRSTPCNHCKGSLVYCSFQKCSEYLRKHSSQGLSPLLFLRKCDSDQETKRHFPPHPTLLQTCRAFQEAAHIYSTTDSLAKSALKSRHLKHKSHGSLQPRAKQLTACHMNPGRHLLANEPVNLLITLLSGPSFRDRLLWRCRSSYHA